MPKLNEDRLVKKVEKKTTGFKTVKGKGTLEERRVARKGMKRALRKWKTTNKVKARHVEKQTKKVKTAE